MAEKKLDPVAVLGKDRDGFLRRGRTKKAVKHVRIEGWATVPSGTAYQAPELAGGVCIGGRCYGHPKFEDGEQIKTSEVVAVNGRLITVASGKVYRLGRPSGKFLAWLRKEGRVYDRKEPIKDLRRMAVADG